MNHIGAKTEAAQTAWDQLAQTQNYDHPIRNQQQSQPPTLTPPSSAPKLQTVNNQTQPPVGQIQQTPPPPPQQTQQPEYGDELHPELVNNISIINENNILIGK